MSKITRKKNRLPLIIFGLILICILIYNIPYVNEKLAWRLDDLRTQVVYFFNPPDKAVFIPEQQGQIDKIVTATFEAMERITPTASVVKITSTPLPIASPTAAIPPAPASFTNPGVTYVDQHGRWNYCGPANITMALNFWGWKGNRDDVAKVVKPGINDKKMEFIDRGKSDKNVMPYELVDFVNNHTDLHALQRFGGDINLLKRLISSGFPVVIEKGYYERDYMGKIAWMGHYLFVTGYDDAKDGFIVQDAWLVPGKNLVSKYDEFANGWRNFNYLFMIVYPADKESKVYDILGNWGDPKWADQNALDTASREVKTLTGIDAFFAWFNKGTSHVQLLEYVDAASAYDEAFNIYATLGEGATQRPYHMMWYQTWPYRAYFYTGRYQDVIDLANTTLLKTIDKPTLEESLYWRGMAEQASGNLSAAIADYQTANHLNPKMSAIIDVLQSLGLKPETPVN
ncbi:MAG: C39 family peptidase [Chloroflexota bacterium]